MQINTSIIKKAFFSSSIFLSLSINLLFGSQTSYSLSDCFGVPLDQKLVKKMNLEHGVFIEVGANNGLTQSNTKLLEEYYGWTGILIEPSPNLFSELLINRPNSLCFQCALGSFSEDNTYLEGDFNGTLMSSVGGNRSINSSNQKVFTRSLQSILDECGVKHINFFSLDTEGYEFNILQGIDFEKTTFDYMLIEIYSCQYDKIINFLASKNYQMVENFSNYNRRTNPLWDGTHNDYLFKRLPINQ